MGFGLAVDLIEGVFEFGVLLLIRDGSCYQVEGFYSLLDGARRWAMIFLVNRIPFSCKRGLQEYPTSTGIVTFSAYPRGRRSRAPQAIEGTMA